jgi:uncharacterized protein YoxC
LVFAAVLIILRIIAHLHYRGVIFTFRLTEDKEIKTQKDIEKIKHKILRKACAEYIRVAERAVTSVPTLHIAERAVSGMGFIGWKYTGILPFIETFEYGLLGTGFVLALVFEEYTAVYGLLAIITFAVLRIFHAFFDARTARAQLISEMVLFIEREIGRFYASDTGGALLRLKNDLTEAINSIGTNVADAMDKKLINMNDTLVQTLHDWEASLDKATRIHTAINESAEYLAQSGAKIQTASDLLASHMQGHSKAMSEQLISLVDAIGEMKESLRTIAAQAEFLESNQQTLEKSLTSYEASLQALTGSIGDGLGAFINLHAQTSAQTINDTMKANIEKIMNLMQGEK